MNDCHLEDVLMGFVNGGESTIRLRNPGLCATYCVAVVLVGEFVDAIYLDTHFFSDSRKIKNQTLPGNCMGTGRS
jgi:hypothetical protein